MNRNFSQRFNSNSQSANTCSSICSVQQFYPVNGSFRYVDTDCVTMNRSKLPLIVSFRRNQSHCKAICSLDDSMRRPKYTSKHKSKLHYVQSGLVTHHSGSSMNLTGAAVGCGLCLEDKITPSHDVNKFNGDFDIIPFNISQKECIVNRQNSPIDSNSSDELYSLPLDRKSSEQSRSLCDFYNGNRYGSLKTGRRLKSSDDNKRAQRNASEIDLRRHCRDRESQSLFQAMQEKAHQLIGRHTVEQNKRTLPQVAYKSPYESPEMTASCKQLEKNLQQILADLILYPRSTDKKDRRRSFRSKSSNKRMNETQLEQRNEIMKSVSYPSLNRVINE